MKSPRQSATRKRAVKAGFRSGLEMKIAKIFDDHGIKYKYEPKEHIIEYDVPIKNGLCLDCGSTNVVQRHKYLTDFVLNLGKLFVEVKGRFTAKDRKKMLAVREAAHKSIKFLIVLQSPKTKITKRVTLSDWCDKNGFDWCSAKAMDIIEKVR